MFIGDDNMDKEKFKNLDILAQIEHVNKILKEGKTLTNFSEEIGLSRKTISKNFSKFGYKYSQSKKQYILDNTNVQAREQKKYYKNTVESNIISPKEKEKNTTKINNITRALDISENQKNSLIYLIDNVDKIKEIIDSQNKDYKNIKDSNVNNKEDLINDIYSFKQVKRDYRVKTLKLDIEVQNGFERIAQDLKDSSITQQELLNYILNQYIKFYENIKNK